MALATLVTSHITWAFAARSRTRTHFRLGAFGNPRLLAVLLATLALQFVLQTLPPAAALLGLAPLGWTACGVALALGLVPATVIELSKLAPGRDAEAAEA